MASESEKDVPISLPHIDQRLASLDLDSGKKPKMGFTDLPIKHTLKNYNFETLQADVLAGFTVAVTLIPQGLAYGSLARLPVQYGLYSGFVGGFVYLIFGTAKDITLGPTAIMSLFVAQYCNGSIALASAMTFYSGLVLMFAFAFLGVGGCISDFISHHVITGFCSAASFVTTITQIPKILGLHTRGRAPLRIVSTVLEDLHLANRHDCFIGFFSISTLVLLKNLPNIAKNHLGYESPSLKILSTARNAIVVFVLATITYTTCREECAYTLISIDVESKGLIFQYPDVSRESFLKLAKSGALVIIPFMAFLESISIARTFGKVFGYRPDEFWESFAIGLSNVIGSYFGSFPVTGSFSRTALNASTGVKTTFGGIITSLIVIVALSFMLPVFHFIPKAALGAIIVCAAAGMFEPIVISHGKRIFSLITGQLCRFAGVRRQTTDDFSSSHGHVSLDGSIACFVTFVMCFYGLAVGIMLGLGVSIGSILYRVSHPHISSHLNPDDPEMLIVRPTADSLSYSACNYIYNRMYEILLNVGYDVENDEPNTGADMVKVDLSDADGHVSSETTKLMSSSVRSLLSQKVMKVVIDLRNVRIMDHDVLDVFKSFEAPLLKIDNNVQYSIRQYEDSRLRAST